MAAQRQLPQSWFLIRDQKLMYDVAHTPGRKSENKLSMHVRTRIPNGDKDGQGLFTVLA